MITLRSLGSVSSPGARYSDARLFRPEGNTSVRNRCDPLLLLGFSLRTEATCSRDLERTVRFLVA